MSVIVFDSNKKFIKVTAPGPQGPKGDPAPNVLIQFSPDNANWHTDYQQGDAYVRFSNDNGATWTNGVPIATNADTLDGYHASDFQAMIDQKVDEFIVPRNGDTVIWHKVGELTTDIGSGTNNLTLLVSGVSDYGNNKPGVDLVQVSTRGVVSVDVYSLATPGRRTQTYGYVNNTSTGKTEIWVKRNAYTYETHFAVLNAYNAAYGNLASSSTEPSGIVYVGIKTHWTSGNDGSGSGLDADTVDGFDASQTPAPNVIVPLDANGVLDLSATYVRSNVYTLRRVELTNATSDYMLQVGEEAYISFSNTTSVPLRIATQSGTYYECHLVCSNTGGTSGGTVAPIYLNPNNTTYNNSFIYAEVFRNSTDLASQYVTYSALKIGYTFVNSVFYITNFVQYKNVKGIFDTYGYSQGYPCLVNFSTDWRDTTTPWTSLGTITFPQASSGYIVVRRLV